MLHDILQHPWKDLKAQQHAGWESLFYIQEADFLHEGKEYTMLLYFSFSPVHFGLSSLDILRLFG